MAVQEAQPTTDSLLPQILPLTPRGPAWGTDEVGDGKWASPVQRTVWRALAAWAAGHLGLDWTAATQTFPSAITYTLTDWEKEYVLPGPCSTGSGGAPVRQAAVRAKFASVGGQSPDYFVCLAYSLGYAVTIEDPVNARRIINGTDKAAVIAGYHDAFLKALKAAGHVPGGVAVKIPVPPVETAPLPPPVFAPAPRTSAQPVPPVAASVVVPAPAKPGFWASALGRLRTAYPKKEG